MLLRRYITLIENNGIKFIFRLGLNDLLATLKTLEHYFYANLVTKNDDIENFFYYDYEVVLSLLKTLLIEMMKNLNIFL